jgi:hypothetical protein
MPSVAGRTPPTLWPGPATDENVRGILGEHLDQLEHDVSAALADQDDDASRAVNARRRPQSHLPIEPATTSRSHSTDRNEPVCARDHELTDPRQYPVAARC